MAADGGLPRQVYARPHDPADPRARLAVIIAGTGLSRAASEAAIERLPAALTLAIDAYAARPDAWAGAARRTGHELLVTVPLQEATASLHDRGPRALLATASADENGRRLETVLSAWAGYVGVLAVGGTALKPTVMLSSRCSRPADREDCCLSTQPAARNCCSPRGRAGSECRRFPLTSC